MEQTRLASGKSDESGYGGGNGLSSGMCGASGDKGERARKGVNVKVIARCRPLNAHEEKSESTSIVECRVAAREIVCHFGGRRGADVKKTFVFDGVCDPKTTQSKIFEQHIIPLVDEVLHGFNCTIFAYGQTGTGKTFTMEGIWDRHLTSEPPTPSSARMVSPISRSRPLSGSSGPAGSNAPGNGDVERQENVSSARMPNGQKVSFTTASEGIIFNLPAGVGIIPRSVAKIFERVTSEGTEYSMTISFLEIYNEELIDLLHGSDAGMRSGISDGNGGTQCGGGTGHGGSSGGAEPLRIYDAPTKGGTSVKGLLEVEVKSLPEVYTLLTTASKRRRTAETCANQKSSRSHSIFTITIRMRETNSDGEDIIRIGKLNLVDLAGSENIHRSGTSNCKDRTKEAGIINQSLVALGRVINALTSPSQFVPYRDSKLTRLLQDSLGGRTKTCIIATVSPSPTSAEETLSTLDYAHRAKNIRNKPEINQKVSQKFVIREMSAEVDRLKREIQLARERSGDVVLTTTMYNELEKQIAEYTALKKAFVEQNKIHEALESDLEEQKILNSKLLVEKQQSLELSTCLAEVAELSSDHSKKLKENLVKQARTLESLRRSHDRLNALAEQLSKAQIALQIHASSTAEQLYRDLDENVLQRICEDSNAACILNNLEDACTGLSATVGKDFASLSEFRIMFDQNMQKAAEGFEKEESNLKTKLEDAALKIRRDIGAVLAQTLGMSEKTNDVLEKASASWESATLPALLAGMEKVKRVESDALKLVTSLWARDTELWAQREATYKAEVEELLKNQVELAAETQRIIAAQETSATAEVARATKAMCDALNETEMKMRKNRDRNAKRVMDWFREMSGQMEGICKSAVTENEQTFDEGIRQLGTVNTIFLDSLKIIESEHHEGRRQHRSSVSTAEARAADLTIKHAESQMTLAEDVHDPQKIIAEQEKALDQLSAERRACCESLSSAIRQTVGDFAKTRSNINEDFYDILKAVESLAKGSAALHGPLLAVYASEHPIPIRQHFTTYASDTKEAVDVHISTLMNALENVKTAATNIRSDASELSSDLKSIEQNVVNMLGMIEKQEVERKQIASPADPVAETYECVKDCGVSPSSPAEESVLRADTTGSDLDTEEAKLEEKLASAIKRLQEMSLSPETAVVPTLRTDCNGRRIGEELKPLCSSENKAVTIGHTTPPLDKAMDDMEDKENTLPPLTASASKKIRRDSPPTSEAHNSEALYGSMG